LPPRPATTSEVMNRPTEHTYFIALRIAVHEFIYRQQYYLGLYY